MLWQVGADEVAFAGYATTIGIAEFCELKLNKLDFENITEIKGKAGRKRKVNVIHTNTLCMN